MTIDTLHSIQLTQPDGSPKRLELQLEDPLVFVVNRQTGETVGQVWQTESATGGRLEVYEGKGGVMSVCHLENGLKLFGLPGSVIQVGDMKIELFGERIEPYVPKISGFKERIIKHFDLSEIPVGPQTLTRQAMVLGAGIGSRILPLTTDEMAIGKPALPLDADETVLGRLLKQLHRHGIQDVMINTFCHRPSVQKAFRAVKDLTIHEIKENRATGTAGGLREVLAQPKKNPGYLDIDSPLLVTQGDAVTNVDFTKLILAHQHHRAAITIGCQVVDDADVDKFGIIATCSQRGLGGLVQRSLTLSGEISHFMEKPSLETAGPHRLASTGFYVLAPEVFPLILEIYDRKAAESGGEVEILDFAQDIFPAVLEKIQAGTLKDSHGHPMTMWAEAVEGYWSDIGNPTQYFQALKDIYSGQIEGFELPVDLSSYMGEHGALYWPGTKALLGQVPDVQLRGNVLVAKPFVKKA